MLGRSECTPLSDLSNASVIADAADRSPPSTVGTSCSPILTRVGTRTVPRHAACKSRQDTRKARDDGACGPPRCACCASGGAFRLLARRHIEGGSFPCRNPPPVSVSAARPGYVTRRALAPRAGGPRVAPRLYAEGPG